MKSWDKEPPLKKIPRDYFARKEPTTKLILPEKAVKKVRKFDAGGMASSSPQPAFTQFGATPPAFGSGMVGGMANSTDTGVGGVRAAPAPAMAQAPAMTPTAPTQAMRRGGTVKKSSMAKKAVKFAKGGAVMGRGRGDGCVTKGGTKGRVC